LSVTVPERLRPSRAHGNAVAGPSRLRGTDTPVPGRAGLPVARVVDRDDDLSPLSGLSESDAEERDDASYEETRSDLSESSGSEDDGGKGKQPAGRPLKRSRVVLSDSEFSDSEDDRDASDGETPPAKLGGKGKQAAGPPLKRSRVVLSDSEFSDSEDDRDASDGETPPAKLGGKGKQAAGPPLKRSRVVLSDSEFSDSEDDRDASDGDTLPAKPGGKGEQPPGRPLKRPKTDPAAAGPSTSGVPEGHAKMTASRVEEMVRALEEGKADSVTANQIAKRYPGGLPHNRKWMIPSGWKDAQQNLAGRLSSMPDYPEHREAIQGLLDRLGLHKETLPEPATAKRMFTAEDLAGVLESINDLRKASSSKRNNGIYPHLVKKTKFSRGTLEGWVRSDGSLSSKRKVEDLSRLPGYAENRERLRAAFEQLDQTDTARNLPESSGQIVRGEMTADILADVLARLAAKPKTSVRKIGSELEVSDLTLRKYVAAGRGGLGKIAHDNDKLVKLRNYVERRRSIDASLRAMGQDEQADSLPRAVVTAEEFLNTLREHRAQVADAIGRMRSDPTLPPRDAARAARMPAEAFSRAVDAGPTGPEIRNQEDVAKQLTNVQPRWQEGLHYEIDRLNALARGEPVDDGGMGLVKIRQRYSERLYIVGKEVEGRRNGTDPRLKRLYQHNQSQVQPPRSYGQDRPRQLLRWMSTVVREKFPHGLEVQSYFDREKNKIYMSSNRLAENNKIRELVHEGPGLQGLVDAREDGDPNSRETRHWRKLKNNLSKTDAHGENETVDEILKAIKKKRFQIPTKDFQDDDGKSVNLHAERRIKEALEKDDRGPMDLDLLAGVKSACGQCAAGLGFEPERHRGPFWLSKAASAFLDRDGIIEKNKKNRIGTNVTETRDGKITVNYNTDSDSDAGADFAVAGPSHAAASSRAASESPLSSLSSADSDDGADAAAGSRLADVTMADPAGSPPAVDERDEVDDFLYATVAEVDARRGDASVGSRSLDVMADRPAAEDSDVEMR
jgi:hypothetical protein